VTAVRLVVDSTRSEWIIFIDVKARRTYSSMSTGAAIVEVARTERTAARVMVENFIVIERVETVVKL